MTAPENNEFVGHGGLTDHGIGPPQACDSTQLSGDSRAKGWVGLPGEHATNERA
ncbi:MULTISPECIES: hypothetical protein [unclassified Kribbella]|uniref:hypothetical protein n=1 Tax=unclassified Kribbella TaxID=2644121 RepID=UPI00301626C1